MGDRDAVQAHSGSYKSQERLQTGQFRNCAPDRFVKLLLVLPTLTLVKLSANFAATQWLRNIKNQEVS